MTLRRCPANRTAGLRPGSRWSMTSWRIGGSARPRPRARSCWAPDGLLSQVTRALPERALAEKMSGHLSYEKHDPARRGSGNSRNGTTPKTVLTDAGAVDLAVPRDRDGSFETQGPQGRGLPPARRCSIYTTNPSR